MTAQQRPATCARFYQSPPEETGPDGAKTWIARGANFVVCLSEVRPGTALDRVHNPDEYIVLLPPAVPAAINAGGERIDADGDSLTIVPPGRSSVVARAAGRIVRIFSGKAADLAAKAGNAAIYADGAPEVAPLTAWPDPVGGFRLRHYKLADYAKPDTGELQPRLFRSTNLMVNVLQPISKPRDISKLSPHWHDDFEQGSLVLSGDYVHHLRWPWTADLNAWRADEHAEVGSPSLLVIPATVVHTSRNVGTRPAWLLDIFAPPRLDFSRKPGFVLNAADYPMPASADADRPQTTKGELLAWQKAKG